MIEVLRLDKIEQFGRIPLRGFSCYFLKGEVVSVVLRSNTLKNTLMDIISGTIAPDAGQVYLHDKPVNTIEQERLLKQDVYCIRKVGGLIDNLTVTDNMFLNRKPKWMAKDLRLSIEAAILLNKYGVSDVQPMMKAELLPYAARHIVECLKAVANGVKLILVDDVLNRYTPLEELRFEKLIQQLASEGITFCFFTNTYGKMVAKSSRAIIVRDGAIAANFYGQDLKSKAKIIAALAGTAETAGMQTEETFRGRKHHIAENEPDILVASHISNAFGMHDMNLKIQKGTICGIFDTSSDLETQLIDVLTGRARYSGSIMLDGQRYRPNNGLEAAQMGVYLINTNADYSFAMLNMSLIDNITLMMPSCLSKFGIETRRIKRHMASHILELLGCEYLLNLYPENKPIGYANRRSQMEIVIARVVCAKAKLVILINPSSYYDDFNLPELRKILTHACNVGTTFLLISSNLQQLVYLCDKVTAIDSER